MDTSINRWLKDSERIWFHPNLTVWIALFLVMGTILYPVCIDTFHRPASNIINFDIQSIGYQGVIQLPIALYQPQPANLQNKLVLYAYTLDKSIVDIKFQLSPSSCIEIHNASGVRVDTIQLISNQQPLVYFVQIVNKPTNGQCDYWLQLTTYGYRYIDANANEGASVLETRPLLYHPEFFNIDFQAENWWWHFWRGLLYHLFSEVGLLFAALLGLKNYLTSLDETRRARKKEQGERKIQEMDRTIKKIDEEFEKDCILGCQTFYKEELEFKKLNDTKQYESDHMQMIEQKLSQQKSRIRGKELNIFRSLVYKIEGEDPDIEKIFGEVVLVLFDAQSDIQLLNQCTRDFSRTANERQSEEDISGRVKGILKLLESHPFAYEFATHWMLLFPTKKDDLHQGFWDYKSERSRQANKPDDPKRPKSPVNCLYLLTHDTLRQIADKKNGGEAENLFPPLRTIPAAPKAPFYVVGNETEEMKEWGSKSFAFTKPLFTQVFVNPLRDNDWKKICELESTAICQCFPELPGMCRPFLHMTDSKTENLSTLILSREIPIPDFDDDFSYADFLKWLVGCLAEEYIPYIIKEPSSFLFLPAKEQYQLANMLLSHYGSPEGIRAAFRSAVENWQASELIYLWQLICCIDPRNPPSLLPSQWEKWLSIHPIPIKKIFIHLFFDITHYQNSNVFKDTILSQVWKLLNWAAQLSTQGVYLKIWLPCDPKTMFPEKARVFFSTEVTPHWDNGDLLHILTQQWYKAREGSRADGTELNYLIDSLPVNGDSDESRNDQPQSLLQALVQSAGGQVTLLYQKANSIIKHHSESCKDPNSRMYNYLQQEDFDQALKETRDETRKGA